MTKMTILISTIGWKATKVSCVEEYLLCLFGFWTIASNLFHVRITNNSNPKSDILTIVLCFLRSQETFWLIFFFSRSTEQFMEFDEDNSGDIGEFSCVISISICDKTMAEILILLRLANKSIQVKANKDLLTYLEFSELCHNAIFQLI